MSEVFVGRARELETCVDLLAQARAGRGRVVLVTGEPGIGKSRFAHELTDRAEAEGFASAWGRAWESAGTPAFWPWTQVMRTLHEVDALRAALAGPLVDSLREPGAVAEVADADHARFQLFDAVGQALRRAAERQPLLLVLDDLHAADAATLALTHFVARGLHGAAVLLVITARDVAFSAKPEAPGLLARLAREAVAVPLERLSREDLSSWLARTAPQLETDRLWQASEGNPLFVQELLAAAKTRPRAAWTGAQLPLGVREAVRAHLALVAPAARRLLEVASVFGRELSRATLERFAAGAAGALDEAIASGVLQDAGDGRLRYSHVLLRDELYAGLDAVQRRRLHRDAAPHSRSKSEAAHHALLGHEPGRAAETLAQVRAAMGEASGRLAHEDAARLGARALEALEPELTEREASGLSLAIAEALLTAGELREAQATASRALALAEAAGDVELQARAALLRAAEISFGFDAEAARGLRGALAALPDSDSPLRAEVMARLAVALTNSPDAHESQALHSQATAMARRLHDEKTLLVALTNASGAYPEELSPQERFALYAETVDLAEKLGTVGRVAPILPWHVVSWFELGEPDGAEAAARRVERLLAPYPQPHHRWRPPLVRATVAAIAGRFAEADELSRESLEISRANDVREGVMMFAIHRSGWPYLRGDDGGLAEFIPIIDRVFGQLPLGPVFRCLWDAPLGQVERVRESLRLLRTLPYEQVTGVSQLGWAALRAGLTEEAGFFSELMAKQPRELPLYWGPGGFSTNGPTALLRARLAAALGRVDEALGQFARAAEVAASIRAPTLSAQAELEWAELLAARGSPEAATHARTARDLAASVGVEALVARAEALLAGTPAPVEARASPTADAVSLRREGELWILEARGRRLALKDSRGLGYLAALVQAPHRELHVLELAGGGEDSDAGPALDARALAAYRARAESLRDELAEATAHHDLGRAERLRAELEALGDELARGAGLGGRARRTGSTAERARINVQRRVKDAIARVAECDRALGRHLELSVKTGRFCRYAPTWPAD